MRKLCLGFSFAVMILLVACGSESGTEVSSELPPGFSKPSSERSSSDGGSDNSGESSASGNKVSSASEGGESADNDASIYDPDENTLTDLRDGQVYKTVNIGNQTWMAENLNYRYLGHTTRLDSSSFCYDDDPAYCDTYGRLYLWSAAMDSTGIIRGNTANGCGYNSECAPSGTVRGVCPKGWHLPSRAEWATLIVAVDGSIVEYDLENTAGFKLRSSSGWYSHGNGTDVFGFSALPAGLRYINGDYTNKDKFAYFWSSSENSSSLAYNLFLDYTLDEACLNDHGKSLGFPVRCLKD